jgi:hypothetical protein
MTHHAKSMQSAPGPAVYKQRAIQEAEAQQKVVSDKIKKLGMEESDYEFRELIGKGSFGRVYKRLVDTRTVQEKSRTSDDCLPVNANRSRLYCADNVTVLKSLPKVSWQSRCLRQMPWT